MPRVSRAALSSRRRGAGASWSFRAIVGLSSPTSVGPRARAISSGALASIMRSVDSSGGLLIAGRIGGLASSLAPLARR
eukprot:239475-Alexandrium_andersonii.AAC.1